MAGVFLRGEKIIRGDVGNDGAHECFRLSGIRADLNFFGHLDEGIDELIGGGRFGENQPAGAGAAWPLVIKADWMVLYAAAARSLVSWTIRGLLPPSSRARILLG